jgi:hypothetical protein
VEKAGKLVEKAGSPVGGEPIPPPAKKAGASSLKPPPMGRKPLSRPEKARPEEGGKAEGGGEKREEGGEPGEPLPAECQGVRGRG